MLVDVAGADGREGAAEAVRACAAPCEGHGAGRRLLELGGIEFALGQRWRDDRSVLGGAHECEAARGLESLDGEDDVPCAALAEAAARELVAEALDVFFDVRKVPGLKKKPSTSELLDWLKLILAEDLSPEDLKKPAGEALPKLHGALLKNEQDVHLFERLAFLSRRERGGG